MWNNLSEDLIVEILSRIPLKSLLRFRSVSKSLHSYISSPGFIRLHTLGSPKTVMISHLTYHHRLYTLHPERQLSYTRVTPIGYPFKSFISFSIVGSCNGILCGYEYGNDIILWNPSLRRKVTVPDLPHCSRVIGFGFDQIMHDYKILRTSKTRSFVYTIKTRAWREIASPTTPYTGVMSHQCLFNGALHWVVKRCLTPNECHYYIMAFGLSSEVFSTIELPEPSWETSVVTVIEGCLAVICSKDDGHSCIWVRREYYNVASWTVAFESTTNPFKGVKKVYQRATDGDLLLHHFSKGVIVYNPETWVDWRVESLNRSSYIADMNIFVESLELLDMGTSCDHGTKLPAKREKHNK